MTRIGGLILALALVASACGADPSSEVPVDSVEPANTSSAEPGAATDAVLPFGPSALDDMFSSKFPPSLVDAEQIISGGPPPDGIPPIDDPRFVTVAEANAYLSDGEPVVELTIDGDARAYPVQVLIWHEIVNDTVGGVPVSVTYCPLCNSAVSYVREVRGVETTFGTSGRLFASALVMYDRETESLWTHFDGRAVVGVLAGDQLEVVGSPLLAWADFREAHPEGKVLDRDGTGYSRDYGRNPYVGYDDASTTPFLFRGALDDRTQAKQRVVGVEIDGAAAAYALDGLAQGPASATSVSLGGTDLVILWKAGQSTALEGSEVDTGRDVGSVGVFLPTLADAVMSFVASPDGFVDSETGSTWNILGEAIAGPAAGSQLERVPHLDTFWFAWSTYRPGTELVEEL
ncbi:MAG: DUF3179 domain-containing protein [Acidimicrobiia bacterium]|nr:DUF3179 domain-containing protein [Acidimicrobiia bacterium]